MAVRLSIFRRIKSWLSRKPEPQPLSAVVAGLKVQIKRKGPGSDLAAAKLEGIRLAQLAGHR